MAPDTFMWVDSQSGGRGAASKLKHSFIKKRQIELRKAKLNQDVKMSIATLPVVKSESLASSSKQPPGNEQLQIALPYQADHDHPDFAYASSESPPPMYKSPELGPMDTFPFSGARLNQNINSYFQFHVDYMSVMTFPLSSRTTIHWFWKQALAQPSLGAIMLSSSASFRAAKLSKCGNPQQFRHAMHDALELRSQTIKSLQIMTNDPLNRYKDSTILVVAHICCIEANELNYEAMEGHALGLKRLIDGFGGLDNLAHWTQSSVYCADIWQAMISKRPLLFPMSQRWLDRIPTLPLRRPDPFGARLFAIVDAHSIHPSIVACLERLAHITACFEALLASNKIPEPCEQDRLLLISHKLMSISAECAGVPLDETIRFTIFTFTIIRIWPFQGIPCIIVFVERMLDILARHYGVLEKVAPDLLFWALFNGALAADGLDERGWFVERLALLSRGIGVEEWGDLRRLLEGFLFVCRKTDEPSRELWREILDRRMLEEDSMPYRRR